jgi:hypothetical protein
LWRSRCGRDRLGQRSAPLPQCLELLGRDDEDAPQIAGTVPVAALLTDPRLLLGGEWSGLAEREASVVVADALDVAASVGGEPEEGTDVLRAFRQAREECVALGLARRFRGCLLLALSTSEHEPLLAWLGRGTATA